MTSQFVLQLFAVMPLVIGSAAYSQVRDTQPRYAPVTICEISFHHEKANPKYVSVDAEYVNAWPHGLFLVDRRCPGKSLGIDFADSGLDPSVALINDHLFEIHRAKGTFRGMLKRDRKTNKLYIWLKSVVNFHSDEYVPELDKGEPLQLPEPSLPQWPPTL